MPNNDLISRAAAIDEVERWAEQGQDIIHWTGIKAMLETQPAVDAAPTVGHWVSVKDRLPEDEYQCLLFCKDGYFDTGWFLEDDQKWAIEGCICDDEYITHWIKLPEPPKEDNNAEQ